MRWAEVGVACGISATNLTGGRYLSRVPPVQPNWVDVADLRAQQAMARIAEQVLLLTWAQIFLGIVGAIALVITLFYTRAAVRTAQKGAKDADKALRIAKRNAAAATDLAEQSREASHADLRAWVSIDLDLKSCGRRDDCADLTVNVRLKNIGKTPAVRVGVSVKPSVAPSFVSNYGQLPVLELWPNQMASLMPGDPLEQAFGVSISKPDIEAGIAESRKMGCEPMIVVDAIVHYHTVFDAEGAPRRLTSIRYLMFSDIRIELRKERIAWLDKTGPAEAAQVRFSRDKSAPVYLT